LTAARRRPSEAISRYFSVRPSGCVKVDLGQSAPVDLRAQRTDERQHAGLDVKYVGFDIPTEFVVGYGLDYAERYRNLPFIGTLRPEVYGARTGSGRSR